MGDVLRRESTNIAKVALRWIPKGKSKRGRPKSPWRRIDKAELMSLNLNGGKLQALAQNRQEWRKRVDPLCAT